MSYVGARGEDDPGKILYQRLPQHMTPNRFSHEKQECILMFAANLMEPNWPKSLHKTFILWSTHRGTIYGRPIGVQQMRSWHGAKPAQVAPWQFHLNFKRGIICLDLWMSVVINLRVYMFLTYGSLDLCAYDFRDILGPRAVPSRNSWSLDLCVREPARLDSW